MIDDKEIWQCANIIVKEHGVDAPLHAAQRADELLDQGDLDGKAVWLRIMKAAKKLLEEETDTLH